MTARVVVGKARNLRRGPIIVLGVLATLCFLCSCAALLGRPTVRSIAILVSDDTPAIRHVAEEVTKQARVPVKTFRLASGEAAQREVVSRIQAGPQDTVIAVGLPAARATRPLAGKQVVFCQVFNYESTGLISANMKGVSAHPPVREQFRIWRQLDPRIRRIGVITGPQITDLIAEASRAAKQNGMVLVQKTVSTDRETLYAYKQLLPGVQGVWIVPDNRILSVNVLREMMNLAIKDGKQVLSFSHELLVLGALFSIEADPADIARQALARARNVSADASLPGTAVQPLTRMDVRINAVMLRRFGLSLPRELERNLYAP